MRQACLAGPEQALDLPNLQRNKWSRSDTSDAVIASGGVQREPPRRRSVPPGCQCVVSGHAGRLRFRTFLTDSGCVWLRGRQVLGRRG